MPTQQLQGTAPRAALYLGLRSRPYKARARTMRPLGLFLRSVPGVAADLHRRLCLLRASLHYTLSLVESFTKRRGTGSNL